MCYLDKTIVVMEWVSRLQEACVKFLNVVIEAIIELVISKLCPIRKIT